MSQQNRHITWKKVFRRIAEANIQLEDPRGRQGRRYPFRALVSALVIGCVCAARSLRAVETITATLHTSVRKVSSIMQRISDTTLRATLLNLKFDDLRQSLHRQIKASHRRGFLAPFRFRFGLVALDGKCIGKLNKFGHPDIQKVCPKKGVPYGLARVHVAYLVSSEAAVCIDLRPIPGDTNEVGAVPSFTREFLETYKRTSLFEAIINDAGNASLEHATLINDYSLGYIFAVKKNCGDIYSEATRVLANLGESQAEKTVSYSYRGNLVTQRIWRVTIQGHLKWTHARQLVRVERTVTREDKLVSLGNRFFVTNLVPGRLSGRGWLEAIRRYWRLENEGNWTHDVVWKEDAKRTPWITEPGAVYALAMLRSIAFNVVSILRSQTRRSWDFGKPEWLEVTRAIKAVLSNPAFALIGRQSVRT